MCLTENSVPSAMEWGNVKEVLEMTEITFEHFNTNKKKIFYCH